MYEYMYSIIIHPILRVMHMHICLFVFKRQNRPGNADNRGPKFRRRPVRALDIANVPCEASRLFFQSIFKKYVSSETDHVFQSKDIPGWN